jgi:hypothetical protein
VTVYLASVEVAESLINGEDTDLAAAARDAVRVAIDRRRSRA